MLKVEAVLDNQLDLEFLKEFRTAGLKWTAYAAFAGALLFLMFILLGAAGLPNTPTMQLIRLVVAVLLLCVAACVYFGVGVNADNYVLIAAIASSVALIAALALPLLLGGSPRDAASQVTPALLFGLFLHYAFLRLPILVAAGIGWALCALAAVLLPGPFLSSEALRVIVYIAFANVFGVVILQLIESRERSLFLQKREAYAAREEARVEQLAAEESDRQKTRLIAAVSHDLRQPMTAAFAYIDLAMSRLSRGEHVQAIAAVSKAQSAINMLGSTLDHLLTAARYDSGTEPLDIRPIELRSILQEIYEAHVLDCERRGVSLSVRLPRQRLLLMTDERSIHRVLGNLVSNAIKFTDGQEADARVLVSARLRGSLCRIDVYDTGIGIPRGSFGDIWSPYVQLNNAERDRERGLGLGLFLVRRVLEQLPGHSIAMDSRLGRGSRFTVMLPTVSQQRATYELCGDPVPSQQVGVAPLRGASLLVLEDDRDTRVALVELVESWGVIAISAGKLADLFASQKLRPDMVDAIICDYRLASGTNGIDAIASLRQRLGYAPHAVLITGEPDVEPLRARVGPDTVVLHKPFAPEALARSLLDAVQARRSAEPT